jgi:hypothetical protein
LDEVAGAAQAPASLVAEIIVGELADALGLHVPARVLIDIPPELATDDRNDELAQLLRASIGRSLGFQYLLPSREFRPSDVPRVDPILASSIVWLDGLVLNPDRTQTNPNLLWSHGRLWLIDHGSSLGFQHAWARVTEQSPRLPWKEGDRHLLRAQATRLHEVDPALAARLDRSTLEAAVAAVPDEYLVSRRTENSLFRRRAAYVAFLWKRLQAPRPFVPSRRVAAGRPA